MKIAKIDEEERIARQKEEDALKLQQERQAMSSVMRKNLPRPTVIDASMFDDREASRIEKQINAEMLALMVHDNQNYPLKGMKASKLPVLDH